MLGRAQTNRYVGSVGKTDYISELNANATNDTQRRQQITGRSEQLENQLQTQGRLSSVMVNPWGAVFGLRETDGTWYMNLVKNATVLYRRAVVQKRTFRSDKIVPNQFEGEQMYKQALRRDAQGLVDRKGTEAFYANVAQPMSERPISTCVNLGHHQFFPGSGVAVYKDLASINIH